MSAVVNLEGERRGKLVVVRSGPRCLCKCDCGKEREVGKAYFLEGGALSCGCSSKAYRPYGSNLKNRENHPGAYQSWVSMRDRCNPVPSQFIHHPTYVGVTVCDRWNDFGAFFEDMGDRPPEHTLDRVDNSKGYGPDNCRWVTRLEQSRNRREWKHSPEGLKRINLNRRST